MKKLLTVVLGILLAGCASTPRESRIVVTDPSQLDAYVGKTITIRNEVSNTKTPEIIGVDVSSDAPDLRGEMAEAEGVLEKWTDTKESIAAADAIAGPIQTRGPGTYYRLFDSKTHGEAQVRKIK